MSAAEAVAAQIRDVDGEIARLVGERRRLAEQLHRARLAAGSPCYHHSDDVEAAAIFVDRLGRACGGELAAVVLRKPATSYPLRRANRDDQYRTYPLDEPASVGTP